MCWRIIGCDRVLLYNMIHEDKYSEFSKFFLNQYFGKGFGSMNKTDIEILIFHALQQFGTIAEMSDFEVCRLLKIPESKVKRLRYESNIVYGDDSDKQLKVRLYNSLSNAKFVIDKRYIQFGIEDKFLRNWFNSKVKEINGFTDTSHNSEIIKINNKTFAEVLKKLYRVEECYNRFLFEGEDIEKLEKLGFDSIEKFTNKILEGTANVASIVEILKLCSLFV